jgi:hypothetical protein
VLRRVAYLVIIVLVAAAGIIRLWLQQRRQVTQMDTIQGFSSALEAMAPKLARRGAGDSRVRRKRSLKGWLVAQPGRQRRRMAARRQIEARRVSSHRMPRGARQAGARSRRATAQAGRRSPDPHARRANGGRGAAPSRRIDRGRSTGQQGWAR